ncbi:MAG: hypothetical protein M5U28_46560 [Sandaracinaceae bacterium]|nr:hypothetical protein [Sandaracinaceae bacterium]
MLIAAWHNYRVKRAIPRPASDDAVTGESGYCGDGGPALDATPDLPAGGVSDGADSSWRIKGRSRRVCRVRSGRIDGARQAVRGR